MSYTYTINTGDGTTTVFPFSFAGQDNGYLRVTDIQVYVNKVNTPFTIIVSDPNKVVLSQAPASGAEVLIRRVMPKDTPYADFARGNPFSQDTLNNTNLQMLYNIQEIYDGYLPDGFFFRQDIDMHGFKFINLGPGSESGDSVNFDQYNTEVIRNNTQDGRLVILEDSITTSTIVNYVSQLYQSVSGGETTINTTNGLHAAALYINGLFQHKAEGAYMQTGGVVTLAEPLVAGDSVYLILGSDLPGEALYASIESVAQLNSLVSTINSNLTALTGRVTTVEGKVTTIEGNYAKKGANTDITSIAGLTTPLSLGQGGVGSTTDTGARANLSAAKIGVNSDITQLATLTGGVTGLTTGTAASSGIVGEVLTAVSASSVATSSGVSVNLATLSLPAGEWELSDSVQITNSGNVTTLSFGTSTTSVTLPTNWFEQYKITTTVAAGTSIRQGATRRIRVTSTTTLYLVANITFTGTNTALGYIRAQRVR